MSEHGAIKNYRGPDGRRSRPDVLSETSESNDQNTAQLFKIRPLVLYAALFDCGTSCAIHLVCYFDIDVLSMVQKLIAVPYSFVYFVSTFLQFKRLVV